MPDKTVLQDAKRAAGFLLEAVERRAGTRPLFVCVGHTHYCTYDMAFTLALIYLLRESEKNVRLGLEHEYDAVSRYFSSSFRDVTRLPKAARRFTEVMPDADVRSMILDSGMGGESILVYWALENGIGIDCLDLMTRNSNVTEDMEALDLSDDFTREKVKAFGRVSQQNRIGPRGIPGVPIRNDGIKANAMNRADTFKPDIYILLPGRDHLAGHKSRPDSQALDSKLRDAGCETVSILIEDEAALTEGKNSLPVLRGAGPVYEDFFHCLMEGGSEDFIAAERRAMLDYFAGTEIPMADLLARMDQDRARWAAEFAQVFRDRLDAYGL
jgi:hypothetical protein